MEHNVSNAIDEIKNARIWLSELKTELSQMLKRKSNDGLISVSADRISELGSCVRETISEIDKAVVGMETGYRAMAEANGSSKQKMLALLSDFDQIEGMFIDKLKDTNTKNMSIILFIVIETIKKILEDQI